MLRRVQIDKLEVLIPEDVPKRRDVWRKFSGHRAKLNTVYALTWDADIQLALRIHEGFRGRIAKSNRHIKVDFTDTRLLSAEDLLWRLTWLFRIPREQALLFRIARIDFTADVFGVPVEWFRQHSRVKRKRKPQSYVGFKAESSKGSVTSVVFGKRPDLYRIYDRIAEKRERGADILHGGMLTGAPVPIVTRIERQCSGRAVPKNLGTLGSLIKNAAAADPFPGLVCRDTKDQFVSTEDWEPRKWLMNVGLAAVVEQFGEATVRARLNRSGNANRYFFKYSDLLRANSLGVTTDRLREIYRKGTIKQLNLPTTDLDGKVSYPQGGVSLLL